VICPYDKYQFSDFLFINTQLRFSHANQEAFSKSKFLYELAQRIFDQMNFIPFMTHFTHENLHYRFKDLFDSLSYQRIIRSETLRNLLQFLKKFTSAIHLNKKGKLRLDLPFEAIPAAIILYSNTIPLIQSSLFVKIYIQNAPQDIINLFERLHYNQFC
jgi:hypothetical protein